MITRQTAGERRGSARARHQARLRWLSERFRDYADAPGLNDDVDDRNRPALDRLVDDMASKGLWGTSGRQGRCEIARRLLSELRGEKVMTTW